MFRKSKIFSTQRRRFLFDRIFSSGVPVMRFYAFCASRQFLYVMSDDFDYCSACLQINRFYELISFYAEMARLDRVKDKLIIEFSAAHRAAQEVDVRLIRLRK